MLQDKLYNYEKRCGYIYDIIKNRNKKNQIRMPPHQEPTDGDIVAMVEFFKTCVVWKDYSEIVEKLKLTADYRKHQLQSDKDQFASIHDFYFADPSLVCVMHVCLCMCACVRVCSCMCACVYVCERE